MILVAAMASGGIVVDSRAENDPYYGLTFNDSTAIQPSETADPAKSLCGYSLDPFDYFTLEQWESMRYDERDLDEEDYGHELDFVQEKCETGQPFCYMVYDMRTESSYQAYRKNGKKFYPYKKYEENCKNRLKINDKYGMRKGDYIDIESRVVCDRFFRCFIPITTEKYKELCETRMNIINSKPSNSKSVEIPFNSDFSIYYDESRASGNIEKNKHTIYYGYDCYMMNGYTWELHIGKEINHPYLELSFVDTIYSDEKPDDSVFSQLKYYIGEWHMTKEYDGREKKDYLSQDNLNNHLAIFVGFRKYFKKQFTTNKNGNLKVRLTLKKLLTKRFTWAGLESDEAYLIVNKLDFSGECVDFSRMNNTGNTGQYLTIDDDLDMEEEGKMFYSKLTLTKEERKRYKPTPDDTVYWTKIPAKYRKMINKSFKDEGERKVFID